MKHLISAAVISVMLITSTVSSNEVKQRPSIAPEPELVRVTCYTETGNNMANGEYPYEGCVAGRPEDIGKTCIIYDTDMRLVGFFDIKDTGGYLIRTGSRIDVYRDTLSGCYDWIDTYGDYMYIQIVDSEG